MTTMIDGRARQRILCALILAALALAAVLVVAPASAFAYDYTVRVWGGNESTTEGIIHQETVSGGRECTLDTSWATPKDDKYYVKGFRVAGEDKLYPYSTFPVNEDMDFVVAYGIKGEQVSYTVRYVESGTGNELVGSESGQNSVTYYGNKGDKPVVAYEHIPGYRPLYRNITGTLKDEGQNNWTFEYIALAEGENEEGTTPATTTTTVTTTTGTSTTTGGGTTSTGGGTTSTGGGTPAATGATPAAASPAAGIPTSPPRPTTEQIRDIDNPLASGQNDAKSDSGIPVALIFGISAAVVAGLAALIYFLRRRSKNDKSGPTAPKGPSGSSGSSGPSAPSGPSGPSGSSGPRQP